MQYLGLQVNEPAELFAIIVGVNSICVIVFQIPVARIAQKFQPIGFVFTGSSLFALGMLGFAFVHGCFYHGGSTRNPSGIPVVGSNHTC